MKLRALYRPPYDSKSPENAPSTPLKNNCFALLNFMYAHFKKKSISQKNKVLFIKFSENQVHEKIFIKIF